MSAPLSAHDHARALGVSFFDRDPVQVARELLGAVLVRQLPNGPRMAARIVETEAYDCPRDPSCHVIARLPGAAQALGGPPGRVYFHSVYQHSLLNVVCRESGVQAAILIRAAEPVLGEETMRGLRPVKRRLDLTNGPAKLMTALSITPDLDGQSVAGPELYFVPGEAVPDAEVTTTPRIGLRLGADLPWRFLVTGNPWVSPGRPAGA
ncbi:DNA-3-methyladenine glycosylase [Deinococcus sp. Leaf326]|uniref:DNA-3-methyladenine glycosylase n=1 Tax=Deinococcus sp. Leaf326 TaxID=1736338 RepID=UPI0006FBAF52|nr:DNA-3-methyladenine glycosylase [Deinococcus sp. Leaf326]KQR27988.1 3-methyladenine DNA glycosylase [Deinococcus sp. Leaf326]